MCTSFQHFGKQCSKVPSEGSPDPLFGENASKNCSKTNTISDVLGLLILFLSDRVPKSVPNDPKCRPGLPNAGQKNCFGHPNASKIASRSPKNTIPNHKKDAPQLFTTHAKETSHTPAAGCREANRISADPSGVERVRTNPVQRVNLVTDL